MRTVLVLLLALFFAEAAFGAGNIPIPNLKAQSDVVHVYPLWVCEDGQSLEARWYHDAVGNHTAFEVALPKDERGFFVSLLIPVGDPDTDQSIVYIDSDRDGMAEEKMIYQQAVDRWGQWCRVYDEVRRGK